MTRRVQTECHECGCNTFTVIKEYADEDLGQEHPLREILICTSCTEEYPAKINQGSSKGLEVC
jgi:hypothetical protein